MVVVGLDLSLKATGVCVLSGDNHQMDMKTFLLQRESIKGVEAATNRLISIADDIISIIDQCRATTVIIEAAASNQKWQAAAIGEVHGVVKADILRKTGIIPMVEQATKMRKAVVGSVKASRIKVIGKNGKVKSKVDYGIIGGKRGGTFKKATVKDIIEQRLLERGLVFPSQDEMDAFVAARFAWDILLIN